ncbi:MAG: tRNA uridine-5-carboxymethylaminomethyl(34) synthesis GTPase MnmE [Bdellovibrionota bacterium]
MDKCKDKSIVTDVVEKDLSDPIVALASGKAPSAIAILRITGRGCLDLLPGILSPKSKKPWQHSKMRLCRFYDPETKQILDEPMAVFFQAPHSFTGEDSIEIYAHGGPFIIQACLRILLTNGFREAEAGEFSRRAFLNGKLDLTAAEGIKELIHAESQQQWLAARQLSSGKLAQEVESLKTKLIAAMAYLEARIDFPDEKETSDIELLEVKQRVDLVKQTLLKLKSSYTTGRIASKGLKVALFGQPNCGKSTLMNELLRENRAIVTPIAGTTRDYLEESCHINGRLIRLIDTAGIRKATDEVEKIGITQSINIAKSADIVLFILPADASSIETQEMEQWIKKLRTKQYIRIVSKADLRSFNWSEEQITISCKQATGVDKLKSLLCEQVDDYIAPISEETCITSARHLNAIEKALKAIDAFERGYQEKQFEEMLAFELQQATKALVSIIGEIDNENILDSIFSTFCIGK